MIVEAATLSEQRLHMRWSESASFVALPKRSRQNSTSLHVQAPSVLIAANTLTLLTIPTCGYGKRATSLCLEALCSCHLLTSSATISGTAALNSRTRAAPCRHHTCASCCDTADAAGADVSQDSQAHSPPCRVAILLQGLAHLLLRQGLQGPAVLCSRQNQHLQHTPTAAKSAPIHCTHASSQIWALEV